jgi:hypothetical protein
MLIIKGKVWAVCPDSGHYKPTDNSTLALLQALRMHAVPLEDVAVFSWNGALMVMADDFTSANADWNKLVANQQTSKDAIAQDWYDKQPAEVQKWFDKITRPNRQAQEGPAVPQHEIWQARDGPGAPAAVENRVYGVLEKDEPSVLADAGKKNYEVYKIVRVDPDHDFIPDTNLPGSDS